MFSRNAQKLVLVAFLAAACCCADRSSASRQEERQLTRETAKSARVGPSRPDVVLISVDTLRADHLGVYGYPVDTSPNIDRLASEAVVFARHHSQAPITLPSHVTMLTGLEPRHHGVRDNGRYRLTDRARTLAEWLKAAGYRTGAFIASEVLHNAFGLGQGFDTYEGDFDTGWDEKRPYIQAGPITKKAIQWLTAAKDHSPLFLFVHYYDPHMPYRTKDRPNIAVPYDKEIAYVDEQIGRLIDALRRMGRFDGALFVITSDHGQSLGEHGITGHTTVLYQQTLHVPLIMRFPGGAYNGRVAARRTRSTDLVPTMLSFLEIDADANLDGADLMGAIRGDSDFEDRDSYAESKRMRMEKFHSMALCSERWKLISKYNMGAGEKVEQVVKDTMQKKSQRRARVRAENAKMRRARKDETGKVAVSQKQFAKLRKLMLKHRATRELFDLDADPGETRNLYNLRPKVAQQMEQRLKEFTGEAGEDVPGEAFSPRNETIKKLRALGYMDVSSNEKN